MTPGQLFALIWGVGAIGMGLFFFLRPEVVEARYRAMTDRNSIMRQLRERHAPTEWTIRFYRVGGVVFAVIGLMVFIAASVGALK